MPTRFHTLFLSILLASPAFLGCNDDDVEDPLTADQFVDEFETLFCSKLEECGEFSCSDATGTTGQPECENFDAEAGEACLVEADWSCDDTLGLPIPPTACGSVCLMSSGTGTTTGTTGTTGT